MAESAVLDFGWLESLEKKAVGCRALFTHWWTTPPTAKSDASTMTARRALGTRCARRVASASAVLMTWKADPDTSMWLTGLFFGDVGPESRSVKGCRIVAHWGWNADRNWPAQENDGALGGSAAQSSRWWLGLSQALRGSHQSQHSGQGTPQMGPWTHLETLYDETVGLQTLGNSPEMGEVLLIVVASDEKIIHVGVAKRQASQNLVNKPLKGLADVSQSGRHSDKFEKAEHCSNDCLRNIGFIDWDLMVGTAET